MPMCLCVKYECGWALKKSLCPRESCCRADMKLLLFFQNRKCCTKWVSLHCRSRSVYTTCSRTSWQCGRRSRATSCLCVVSLSTSPAETFVITMHTRVFPTPSPTAAHRLCVPTGAAWGVGPSIPSRPSLQARPRASPGQRAPPTTRCGAGLQYAPRRRRRSPPLPRRERRASSRVRPFRYLTWHVYTNKLSEFNILELAKATFNGFQSISDFSQSRFTQTHQSMRTHTFTNACVFAYNVRQKPSIVKISRKMFRLPETFRKMARDCYESFRIMHRFSQKLGK